MRAASAQVAGAVPDVDGDRLHRKRSGVWSGEAARGSQAWHAGRSSCRGFLNRWVRRMASGNRRRDHALSVVAQGSF